jgi:ribonucleotide reductase beta subunit family protein with ferritin-like domain
MDTTMNDSSALSSVEEDILKAQQRYTLFPLIHHDIWDLYKKQLASFWTREEIDFSQDRQQWDNALDDNERRFIKHVLAFFAGTDTIVALNLMDNFCKEVSVLEAQITYTFQAMMEGIHSEVYSLMIDTYITDPQEKAELFHDMGNVQSVLHKMQWAERWSLNKEDASFAHRLVAFTIVEGLFFSGAFCAIYWLKQRNLLPGLTKSNEFIARDEGMHTDFACLMYSKLRHTRLSENDVHAIFKDAVEVEKEFINESIPCRLIGMNSVLMSEYIEHVADTLLTKLGYVPLFGTRNPFPFMDMIGLMGRSNFFEERPSQYQRADVLNEDQDLDYNEQF